MLDRIGYGERTSWPFRNRVPQRHPYESGWNRAQESKEGTCEAERQKPAVVPRQPSMINGKPPVMLNARGNYMAKRAFLAALATMLSVGVFHPAAAQDAAETAAILGGAGPAHSGASSLGAAISRSFENAGNAFRAPNARSTSRRPTYRTARPHATHAVSVMSESGDPFEGVDAPIYRMDNGASISATGGFTPAADARCVKDCPAAR